MTSRERDRKDDRLNALAWFLIGCVVTTIFDFWVM